MIKSKLRATLKNTLAQIDKTAKWHDTYLDHVLETVINSLVYEAFAANPRALHQYTWRYAATIAAGQYEGYTVTLPIDLVPLPDKRGGLRGIMDHTDPTTHFVPVTDQEYHLMKESQADALITTTPNIIYFVTGSAGIILYGATSTILTHTLTMDVITAFTSLADTQDAPLPYGKDMEVIAKAIGLLGMKPPQDLLDNNSDIR